AAKSVAAADHARVVDPRHLEHRELEPHVDTQPGLAQRIRAPALRVRVHVGGVRTREPVAQPDADDSVDSGALRRMCVLLQEGAELPVIATAPAREVAAGDAARVLVSGGDPREGAARTARARARSNAAVAELAVRVAAPARNRAARRIDAACVCAADR